MKNLIERHRFAVAQGKVLNVVTQNSQLNSTARNRRGEGAITFSSATNDKEPRSVSTNIR